MAVEPWAPPGWSDPWSRAVACEAAGVSWRKEKLRRLDYGEELDVQLADIYAVRETGMGTDPPGQG